MRGRLLLLGAATVAGLTLTPSAAGRPHASPQSRDAAAAVRPLHPWRTLPRGAEAALGARGAGPRTTAAAASRTYGGTTRPDRNPIVLTIRGRRLTQVSVFYETPCGPLAGTGRIDTELTPGGRFTAWLEGPLSGPGGRFFAVQRITGRIRDHSGSGEAVVGMEGESPEGEPCVSRRQRWTVRREAGRVVSGISSQRLPVVVELTPDGKRVDDFWIGWNAPCGDMGEIYFGDVISNFPVRKGRFGDAWRESYERDDGGTNVFEYKLSGSVTAAGTAAGDFQVTFTDLDAQGATFAVCTSPSIRWSARG